MSKISFFIIAAIFGCASANIAKFAKCSEDDVCEINEVNVTPCLFGKRYACTMKKDKQSSASISFQFTPKFSSSNMTAGIYSVKMKEMEEIPFGELNVMEACQFTICPLESGKKQELKYNLKYSKIHTGPYTIKWKLWNSNNETEFCCFRTRIVIKS